MNQECDNLDGYLDGELTPGEGARFAAHLTDCPACREAVDEQQWIDGLLRAPAIAQLESPPAALVESFRGAIARRLQISRLAIGAAAAAVLIVAVGWMVKLNRQADGGREWRVAVSNDVLPVFDEPTATFVGGPDVIVVPVESGHADVTIVRVYPVFEPDYSAQASLDQITSGDEFSWPDLNGG